MKNGLDEVSLANFVGAARGAVERSGALLEDATDVSRIHMKRSMHDAIVDALWIDTAPASIHHTGHMSGVVLLLALIVPFAPGMPSTAISCSCSLPAGLHVGGNDYSLGPRR